MTSIFGSHCNNAPFTKSPNPLVIRTGGCISDCTRIKKAFILAMGACHICRFLHGPIRHALPTEITATRIRESVLSFVRNLQNISTFHGTETDHFGANFGNAKMCLRTEICYKNALN